MTPAATSSTTTAATWSDSSSVRSEKRAPGSADPSFSATIASRRVPCNAGASADSTQATAQMTTVKASKDASGPAGAQRRRPVAERDDTVPGTSGDHHPGGAGHAREHETFREELADEATRLAPSDRRTAISRRRAAPRASSRLPTLAQASSSTSSRPGKQGHEHGAPVSLRIGEDLRAAQADAPGVTRPRARGTVG